MKISRKDVAKARLWEAFQRGQQLMTETGKDVPTAVHIGMAEGEKVIFPEITNEKKLAKAIAALARKKHAEYVILVTLAWIVTAQTKQEDPAAWCDEIRREREKRGGTLANVPGRIEVILAQMRLIDDTVMMLKAEVNRRGKKITFGEAEEMQYLQGGVLRPWTDA